MLNAFRDCGSEIDVGRAVEVRIGCTGLAAESRQVLIGVKHNCLAVANTVADSLDEASGSLSAMQSKSAHPSALAAPDKITGGRLLGGRVQRPIGRPNPSQLIERRADTAGITQIR